MPLTQSQLPDEDLRKFMEQGTSEMSGNLENTLIKLREMQHNFHEDTSDDCVICLRAEVDCLKKQLPDGMKDCTIRFIECTKGHGWLTADNWVQHSCSQCKIELLRKEVDLLKSSDSEETDHEKFNN